MIFRCSVKIVGSVAGNAGSVLVYPKSHKTLHHQPLCGKESLWCSTPVMTCAAEGAEWLGSSD